MDHPMLMLDIVDNEISYINPFKAFEMDWSCALFPSIGLSEDLKGSADLPTTTESNSEAHRGSRQVYAASLDFRKLSVFLHST